MPLPLAWFALQLRFAECVAALTGLPFEEAVLQCTTCYRRFGLGQSRDPAHPAWQDYLRGLYSVPDRAAWTTEYHRAHEQPDKGEFFGCFHYDYLAKPQEIRLHFANNDESGAGPLSRERVPIRQAEIGALCTAITRRYPEAQTIRGRSWLHGIAAYRRLYPPEYGQSARPVPTEQTLASMPLWGQFLDHRGEVKESLATAFLASTATARTFTDLVACFPQRVYAVECGIEHFYRFYGVTRPPMPPRSSSQSQRFQTNNASK